MGDGIGTTVDGLMKDKMAHSADSSDDFDGMDLAVWDADLGFPEIPTSVTDDEHWTIVGCGRWKFKDNIVRLEAHALIEGIERLAVTFGTFIRELSVVDNMSVCLRFARARCRDYRDGNSFVVFKCFKPLYYSTRAVDPLGMQFCGPTVPIF